MWWCGRFRATIRGAAATLAAVGLDAATAADGSTLLTPGAVEASGNFCVLAQVSRVFCDDGGANAADTSIDPANAACKGADSTVTDVTNAVAVAAGPGAIGGTYSEAADVAGGEAAPLADNRDGGLLSDGRDDAPPRWTPATSLSWVHRPPIKPITVQK